MTTKIGRPTIPGQNTSVRLNDEALLLIDQGASLQATVSNKHVSRSAWLRELIDFTFAESGVSETMTPEMLMQRWPKAWTDVPTPHKITVRLEEHQRILLRQFECYVQSLDWTRDLGRNEAVLILITAHGPALNRAFDVKAKRIKP